MLSTERCCYSIHTSLQKKNILHFQVDPTNMDYTPIFTGNSSFSLVYDSKHFEIFYIYIYIYTYIYIYIYIFIYIRFSRKEFFNNSIASDLLMLWIIQQLSKFLTMRIGISLILTLNIVKSWQPLPTES